jgi:uncharacterized surface protein with fasciclin (FAS1) repeats
MSQDQPNTTVIVIAVISVFVVIFGIVTLANGNKSATNEMTNNSSSNMMMKSDNALTKSDSMMMKSDSMSKISDSMMKSETTVIVGGAAMYPSKDIVSNVSNASNLTTLVTAVKAADLVSTLQGPGPFTVFGPSNSAFAKLPAGTVESLVKPENKAKLTSILTYHVVSGTYKTSDLKDGQMLKTVNGQDLKVTINNGKVMINGATIETPNVIQSNGVAHVIDTVLLPN